MSFHNEASNRRALQLPTHMILQAKPSDNALLLLANPHLPYAALCEYLSTDTNPIIYEAQVVESRIYIESGAVVAPHRKTILQIRERNGKQFWLQLERKPTSGRALVTGLGTTLANDQVRINFDDKIVPIFALTPNRRAGWRKIWIN